MAEEAERKRLEELMLSRMKEEERAEYERRKKLEEEERIRKAEEERYGTESGCTSGRGYPTFKNNCSTIV